MYESATRRTSGSREEVAAVLLVGLRDERVAVVRARRVAGLRDGDAVVERRRRGRGIEAPRRELREQPAVGRLVVEDDRVAGFVGAVLDRKPVQSAPRSTGPSRRVPVFE